MTNQASSRLKTCTRQILIFEPDATMAQRIAMAVWGETEMEPIVVDAAKAIACFDSHLSGTFAAIVRLSSEDATTLMEKLAGHSIPIIAYNIELDNDITPRLRPKDIVDVLMEESSSLPLSIGNSIGKIVRNRAVTILVVDDSRSMRAAIVRFLSNQCYQLLEAEDGIEALKVLQKHPEIKLVITDNEMPNMDGFTLVKEIRRQFSMDELAVIGISAKTNSQISVKFINNRANDFLHKPFEKEELYCRVNHNVEMLNRFEIIRDLSNRDHLTKLFNRRYFFDNCVDFIEKAKDSPVTVAMVDIDFFKRVNDSYGHDVGDEVLRKVSALIGKIFDDNAIVSRFGGEEFCILSVHHQGENSFARYDQLRRVIEESPVEVEGEVIAVTVSCGVCTKKTDVQAMIKRADECLYTAKDSGRNKVVMS